jgi:FkbM family methyltransferase
MIQINREDNPKIIIEVGANDGNDTLKYVSHENIFLYTFEPVPVMADFVISKLNDKEYSNYKLLRYAVSDTEGVQQFNLSEPGGNYACSSLNEFSDDIHEKWPGRADFIKTSTIDVQTIRLDTFIEQENIKEIEFLHIDAQGSDLKVLQSLGDKANIVKYGRCEASNTVALYKEVDNNVYSIMKWLNLNGFYIKALVNHHGQQIKIDDLPNSTEEVDIYFERFPQLNIQK